MLAIVGFSVRAAAQCAQRAGYSIIGIDSCLDRDLLAICTDHFRFEEPWLKWLVQRYPQVPVVLAGGLEHHPDFVSELGQISSAIGIRTAEQIASLRSISNWDRWATASGFEWPETIMDGGSLCHSILDSNRWLIKSLDSAGGLGVEDIRSRDLAELKTLLTNAGNPYLQRRITGQSVGVSFLTSSHGSLVTGAARSVCSSEPTDLPTYLYRGSVGPLAIKPIEQLSDFANRVARDTGIRGLWQADFIVNDDRWTLLEINPRWTSSMELIDVVYDVRLIDLHMSCCLDAFGSDSWNELRSMFICNVRNHGAIQRCKSIVYAPHPLEVTKHQSDWWWSNRWDGRAKSNAISFADIPLKGSLIAQGHPVLTVYHQDEYKSWKSVLDDQASRSLEYT